MLFLSLLMACDSMGYIATKAVPSIEQVKPSWANPVDCDEKRVAPAITKKKCFAEMLSCDINSAPIIIEGTTIGGKSLIGDDFYQGAKCDPARTYFFRDSPEAIYQLTVAPDTKAEIRLDTNCAELDVFAASWDRKSCPTKKHASMIRECEMDTKEGDGAIILTTVTKPQTYLVGVDGKEGASGNFRLTIQCSAYR